MSDYVPTFEVPGVHEESLWYNKARRCALPDMMLFIRAPEEYTRIFCSVKSWRADQPWAVRSDIPGPLMIWWFTFNGRNDWEDLHVGHGLEGSVDIDFVHKEPNGKMYFIVVRIHQATGAAQIVVNSGMALEWNPGFMVCVPAFIAMSLDMLHYGAGNGTVGPSNVHEVNARIMSSVINPESKELRAVNAVMHPWLIETRTQEERDAIRSSRPCVYDGVTDGGGVGVGGDDGSLADDDASTVSEDCATEVVATRIVRGTEGCYEIAHVAHVVSTSRVVFMDLVASLLVLVEMIPVLSVLAFVVLMCEAVPAK